MLEVCAFKIEKSCGALINRHRTGAGSFVALLSQIGTIARAIRRTLRLRKSAPVTLAFAWLAFILNSAFLTCCPPIASAVSDHLGAGWQPAIASHEANLLGETQPHNPVRGPEQSSDFTAVASPETSDGSPDATQVPVIALAAALYPLPAFNQSRHISDQYRSRPNVPVYLRQSRLLL